MSTKKYAKSVASKANILLAARACFAQRGFFETSMTDIETAAQTSRGVLYHHFESKDQIILTIIAENLGNAAAKIEGDLALIRTTGEGDLKQLLVNTLKMVESITMGPGKAMSLHVWSLSMLRPDVKVYTIDFFERIRTALKLQLEELQKIKKIDSTANLDALSTALFAVQIPGYVVQRLFLENCASPEEFADSLAILFRPASK